MAWNPLDRLTSEQRAQLDAYGRLLLELNRRMNLISREDEANLFMHHILHSLALTFRQFSSGATIVDWGTGGGLPAIPLAISFPDCHFVAVDTVEKKSQAVRLMGRRLGLENLEVWHGRAERFPAALDYSVSRATAPLQDLWSWHERTARPGVDEEGCWRRGLQCLKGGDLDEEIESARRRHPRLEVASFTLETILDDEYFREKVILECRLQDEPPVVPSR